MPSFTAIAVKMTVILVASCGLAFLLRRSSAALRHLLWIVAVVSILALPVLSIVLPAWNPAAASAPAALTWDRAAAAPAMAPPLSAPAARPRPFDWRTAALALWACGAVAVLLPLFAGILRVFWMVRRSALLEVLPAGSRRVRVVTGHAVPMPMTWGLWRPLILLPAAAAEWDPERRRVVILHELTHVRRFDLAPHLLAQIARALYWFHPLVWVAAARLRAEQERACDDGVLREGVEATAYAAHLLGLARSLRRAWAPCPAVAMAQTSNLEPRLQALLDANRNRRPPAARWAVAFALAAACVVAPLAALGGQAAGAKGTISGTVADASGAMVPHAAIVASNPDTGGKEIAATGEAGDFTLAIPAGHYTVEIRKAGFELFRTKDIVLVAGAHVRIDARLQIGSISETVDVVAPALRRPAPSGAAPRRIRVGGNVQATRLIQQVKPVYPEHAQQQGIEGSVLLRAVVGVDGSLLSLAVINTTADPELAQAALDAVRQWRYQPTLLNGQPVEVATTITVNFRLAP